MASLNPLDPLLPGDRIAILGGGQLGRMLAISAARLGLRVTVLDPDPAAPAAQVADHIAAPFDDADALARLSREARRITLEFENVPLPALEQLEALACEGGAPLLPSSRSLRIAADRFEEKRTIADLGLSVAPHRAVDTASDLVAARAELDDVILKTRRLGYDGKGQRTLAARMSPDEAEAARVELGGTDLIAEARLTLDAEVSVIAVRGVNGDAITFDPARNVHENGILRASSVPARLGSLEDQAREAALSIVHALKHVGAMGVEFFVSNGRLVVNEIAPRVHNSGHWTEAVCPVDQFEAHMRAVAGLPLGTGKRFADAEMTNLLGFEANDLAALARDPGTRIYLYGKREAREGRKMGHTTRVVPRSTNPSDQA